MRRWIVALCVGLSPLGSLGACSTANEDASNFTSTGSGSSGGLADADLSFDASLSIATQFRLVHLSESNSSIDICYRAIGTSDFSGPVLAEKANFGDAGTTDSGSIVDGAASAVDGATDGAASTVHSLGASALARLGVSPVISLSTPGTLEIAIVDGDHPTCNSPLVSATLTLDAGKTAWLAVVGKAADGGASSLAVKRYVVDTRPDELRARVRVVHAAAEHPVPLDLSVSSEQITPLARGVLPYATTLTGVNPPLDSLGYASVAPVAPPTMFVVSPSEPALAVDGGSTWTSAFTDLSLTAGSVHTAFVTDEGPSYAIVSCSELGSGACVLVGAP